MQTYSKPWAHLATVWPILPQPMMARVFPLSSCPMNFFLSHLPCFMEISASGILLQHIAAKTTTTTGALIRFSQGARRHARHGAREVTFVNTTVIACGRGVSLKSVTCSIRSSPVHLHHHHHHYHLHPHKAVASGLQGPPDTHVAKPNQQQQHHHHKQQQQFRPRS